ncbi:hypothetical protein GCM10023084_38310 [Streptomyces lacrimifluminis]|uniref:Uncharacterized protein n=1 Tax=Streptomyces lacrimifluminis TaxID=1500077 RepID=A0A917L3S9_9ACTN|nr:hypothetical protein GCM10012282_39930 [Streptomyces lacrimifluminis]
MLRLALAVRDADGDELVDELVLDDIPNYGRSVRAVLLRAGMLGLLPEPREPDRPQRPRTSRTTRRLWPPRTMTPRSCQQCGCWLTAEDEGHLRALLLLRLPQEREPPGIHGSGRPLPPCRPGSEHLAAPGQSERPRVRRLVMINLNAGNGSIGPRSRYC